MYYKDYRFSASGFFIIERAIANIDATGLKISRLSRNTELDVYKRQPV